jgi:hypothetical protein
MLQKTVNMIIPADDATQNFWGFFDHLYAIWFLAVKEAPMTFVGYIVLKNIVNLWFVMDQQGLACVEIHMHHFMHTVLNLWSEWHRVDWISTHF